TIAFRRRRLLNWLPLGLTYAFLYMGRYNLSVFKDAGGLTNEQFGQIFGWGSATYGLAFLLNGPLTDRWGGRITILISAAGSAACNATMGFLYMTHRGDGLPVGLFGFLYCANMYFQSFGAVSIVKVNASWFHVRERGTLGGIFGILISLGLYFAYDWGYRISKAFELEWLFLVPSVMLLVFLFLSYLFVRDTPSRAGHRDFDLGDASSGDAGPPLRALQVIKKMMTNRIILIIAAIELCSGFLRQSILQWYRDFAKGVSIVDSYVYEHWGMVSCIAGITGGMFAGLISDHLFQSRRAPVSAVLYAVMLLGALTIAAVLIVPIGSIYAVGFTIAV
ncbi:MAG: MFS transporter, partial [Actinomycetota bacterium]